MEICLHSHAKASSDELIRRLCLLKHIIHYYSTKFLSVSSFTKIISWYKSSHCQQQKKEQVDDQKSHVLE